MICPSCGRTVEDGMAFCPHCGSAVIQPFMTDEDKEREDAEVEAALKSLDEIKHTAARPTARIEEPVVETMGVAPATRDFSRKHGESRMSQLIVGMLLAFMLAVLLLVVLPNFVRKYPSWTPTIAESDPEATTSPIGEIAPITELSAQDDPETEEAVIAYNAYEDSDGDKGGKKREGGFVLPDSDTHLYTVEELEGLTEWELEIARNEIYARHGRGFNDSTLQAYFDAQDWYERKYSPEEFDAMDGVMNQTELANVTVIGEAEDSL